MPDKLIKESGETTFIPSTGSDQSWFTPLGTMGKWFSRFFANRAKPYIALQGDPNAIIPKDSKAGDTIVSTELIKLTTQSPSFYEGPELLIRNVVLPELERARRQRYAQFEDMDNYPEIGSAFDIYADDSTQKDINDRPWLIETESPIVKDEIERFFKTIDLERHYWDHIRGICKFGDYYVEAIIDENNPDAGIQRIKALNPNFILRVENVYGYLTCFLQEIPRMIDFNAFGSQGDSMQKSQYIPLDKNQIIHFRLHTSDPKYYPYGKSIAGGVIRVYRSLKLMEDAMLVYRLSRAPERRVFYINTASLPTGKAAQFVENMKKKLKKEKYFNSTTGSIDERFNPLAVDEDLFIPHHGEKETRVEVLPGAQNLDQIDDVKYFMDKLLAGLKIPRDFVVESKDKSPERKANLSQLDVKFAKTISRVQQNYCEGLESLVRIHLKMKKIPQHLINTIKIRLPDPSDMFTKRKLEIDDAKARVVAAMAGIQVGGKPLFSRDTLYKKYFELSEDEIEEEETKVAEEQEEMMEQQAMMGGVPGEDPNGQDPNGDPNNPNPQDPNAPDENVPQVGGRSGQIKEKQPGSESMDSGNEAIKYIDKLILTESNTDKLKIWKNIKLKVKKPVKS